MGFPASKHWDLKHYGATISESDRSHLLGDATMLRNRKAAQVFFYCHPTGDPENTPYHHQIVCLAEGFKSLGISCFANTNYWQMSTRRDEYLLVHDPKITFNDCSIVVLDHDWFFGNYRSSLPKDLFSTKKLIKVYLDGSDGMGMHYWRPEFRKFDFIFKSHFNKKCSYPSNVYPGAFGLSNRMLKETELIPKFNERKKTLLVNFRAKHPVRDIAVRSFLPAISNVLRLDESVEDFESYSGNSYHYLQWAQTGRRHNPNFYKRLIYSAACACFGGIFIPRWPSDPAGPVTAVDKILIKIGKKLNLQSKRIIQWDSWRFWESLAAGCVTFHVDFEKYDLQLPVMPENWRHYIGIDLDNVEKAVERIADEPEIFEMISCEGRLWALDHFSPVPTALRFLRTVGHPLPTF